MTAYRHAVLTPQFLYAALANFFFFTSANFFTLLPLYIHEQGGTEVWIGVIMGVYSVSGILCQPPVGAWVDRVGRRPFMLLGTSLAALSSAAFLLSASLGLFLLLRLLQGVALSLFFVANYTLISTLVPPARRGWALGIFGSSGLLAGALGPPVGEWLIRRFGYPAFFLNATLWALIALAVTLKTPEPERAAGFPPPGRPPITIGIGTLPPLPLALGFLFGLGVGTVFTFLPTFAERLGVTHFSLFYTGYAGAALLVRAVWANLIDSRGRRAVILPSIFIQAIAPVLFTLVEVTGPTIPAFPSLMLVGILAGGAHGFLYPALLALGMDLTPEVHHGRVVGTSNAVQLAGSTLGAVLFGSVAQGFGYGVMFGLLTFVLTAGTLVSLRLWAADFTRAAAGPGSV